MKGATVTRADLCEAVHEEVGLTRQDCGELVERVLELMSVANDHGTQLDVRRQLVPEPGQHVDDGPLALAPGKSSDRDDGEGPPVPGIMLDAPPVRVDPVRQDPHRHAVTHCTPPGFRGGLAHRGEHDGPSREPAHRQKAAQRHRRIRDDRMDGCHGRQVGRRTYGTHRERRHD